jgi:hypothetical protein
MELATFTTARSRGSTKLAVSRRRRQSAPGPRGGLPLVQRQRRATWESERRCPGADPCLGGRDLAFCARCFGKAFV